MKKKVIKKPPVKKMTKLKQVPEPGKHMCGYCKIDFFSKKARDNHLRKHHETSFWNTSMTFMNNPKLFKERYGDVDSKIKDKRYSSRRKISGL